MSRKDYREKTTDENVEIREEVEIVLKLARQEWNNKRRRVVEEQHLYYEKVYGGQR